MADNNFLVWNPTKANQETDLAWSADTQRSGGAVNPSIFPSATANKLFYQLSAMVSSLAAMLATKGYEMSDADVAILTTTLANVVTVSDFYNVDTGAAENEYNVALQSPVGMPIYFVAGHANTGTSYLTTSNVTNGRITKYVDQDLEENNILVGQMVGVVYDGTNFQIIGLSEGYVTPVPEGVYLDKICKYNTPAGFPVGVDSVSDKFVPIIRDDARYVLEDQSVLRYSSGGIYDADACFVNDNTIVVVFRTTRNKVYYISGTYNPSTGLWTWGTATDSGIVVFDPAYWLASSFSVSIKICKIGINKFAAVFPNTTSEGAMAQAGTVSGTTITLGATRVLSCAVGSRLVFDIVSVDTDKFVVVLAGSSHLHIHLCTTSGVATTLRSTVIKDLKTESFSMCKTYTNEFAMVLRDSTGTTIDCLFGSISGYTMSLSEATYSWAGYSKNAVGIASNGDDHIFLASYMTTDTNNAFKVGTIVGGTTITFGTAVDANIGIIQYETGNSLVNIGTDTYVFAGQIKVTVAGTTPTVASTRPDISSIFNSDGFRVIPCVGDLFFYLGFSNTNFHGNPDFSLSFASTESLGVTFSGILTTAGVEETTSRALLSGTLPAMPANISLPIYGANAHSVAETLRLNTGALYPIIEYLTATTIRITQL